MMKVKKILSVILAVAPLLMVLSVYSELPAQVPMHWGIDGNVDRYGDKAELFLLAGISIFTLVLMYGLPKIDPKKGNYERFQGAYEWIILWIMAFFAIIMGLTLLETMNPGRFDIGRVICSMVGVLFIAMGNMMPKVKRNFFTGVKTPWSLSNDVVWNKTHRLGGKCFVFGGGLMILSGFSGSGKIMFAVTILVVVMIAIVPIVMSYIWYKQEMQKAIEEE